MSDADEIRRRRARFVAAALAGMGSVHCAPAPQPPSSVTARPPASSPVEDGDRDGDRVRDYLDRCPGIPEDLDGLDDEDGCPEDDVDEDGVNDTEDACPKVAGFPADDPVRNGCPRPCLMIIVQNEITHHVEFDTGRATISPAARAILDDLARLLQTNPKLELLVRGHRDTSEPPRIAEDRAKAVRKHLIDQGVEARRLSAKSFGEERPIDTNATVVGRARNRRVDFEVVEH
jgi:OmpA-OmpF porin, OOP family